MNPHIKFLEEEEKKLVEEREALKVIVEDLENDIEGYSYQIDDISTNIRYLNTLVEKMRKRPDPLEGFRAGSIVFDDILRESLFMSIDLGRIKAKAAAEMSAKMDEKIISFGSYDRPPVFNIDLSFKNKGTAEVTLESIKNRLALKGWVSFREVREEIDTSASKKRVHNELKWGWLNLDGAMIVPLEIRKDVVGSNFEIRYLLVLPELRKL